MEKVKDFIKKYLFIDVLFFMAAMILPDILIRKFVEYDIGKMPIFRDLCIVSIFAAVLMWIANNKARHFLEGILVFLSSAYCYAQLMHFRFFDTFFSFKKATVINEMFGVIKEITRKLSVRDVMFLLPFIVMFAGMKADFKEKKGKSIIFRLSVIGLCVLLNVFGYKYFMNTLSADRDNWEGEYYLYTNMQNKNRFLSRFGVYEYLCKDVSVVVKSQAHTELSVTEKEELEAFIDNHYHQEENEMSAIFEGKNLIMVLGEAFDTAAINEELTPTLYKLSEEGYYFTNYYAPIYLSATGDSEFISQTGMLPSVDYGTTSYTFFNNSYPYSMANLLNKKDYKANSFHAYIAEFYNRELFHDSLGFITFYDMDKLNIHFWYEYETGINWLYDKDMFRSMMEHTNLNAPFYNFGISVSGHLPYVSFRTELKENLKKIEESSCSGLLEESRCYLAAQMNFDQGIEELLKCLEEKGELDNTVLVIYGDHYPYGIKEQATLDEIVGYSDYQKYHVPFIIYDCSGEYGGEKIDTLGCTFDIYPTVCNLFGIDYSGAYTVGNDLFSDEERKVIFMDHSLLTDDFYYDSNTGSVTVLSDNYQEEELNDWLKEVEEVFHYGQQILTSDYYSWR